MWLYNKEVSYHSKCKAFELKKKMICQYSNFRLFFHFETNNNFFQFCQAPKFTCTGPRNVLIAVEQFSTCISNQIVKRLKAVRTKTKKVFHADFIKLILRKSGLPTNSFQIWTNQKKFEFPKCISKLKFTR